MTHEFDLKAQTWDDDPTRVARAAEVARQIMERVPMNTTSHVLDFGCGTGLLGFQLLPHVASLTFADPSEGMLRRVEEKLAAGVHRGGRTLHLDPDALVLPGDFDAVVSLMTLHHVGDPDAVIRELARHLNPRGWMAICDLDREDGSFHDDPHADVHHGFDRNELVALLEGLGLQRIEVVTAHTMTRERPDGPKAYPLFLLTAQRPA
jgi:ubiquinone/menaquinone biosynthesis C-methylase UbiE